MPSAPHTFDVAVIGGGIAGVTLVVGLLSRGVTVTLYEQAATLAEIGAGVALGPNAARALDALDAKAGEAFAKVVTGNFSPDKQDVFFDFLDGYHQDSGADSAEKWLFRLDGFTGGGSTHRAHFLNELVKLVPEGVAHFHKHLDTIVEHDGEQLELKFHDGTSARHDAVVGCDGIKSRVRRYLYGDDHPCSSPQYTHKYAYRGLIPMETAAAALGEDIARNSHFHLGPNGHFLTFPVSRGKILNVVAFIQDDGEWTAAKLTAPAHKSDAKKDFHDWHPKVQAIMDLLLDDLDRWAIFDLGDHPLPYYNRGRICLVGDAAHATSPHHGAGAGFCIEDSVVMAALLEDAKNQSAGASTSTAVEAAFAAFDASRRERTQWLVQSSRYATNLYDFRDPAAGSDGHKIWQELVPRYRKIWDGDITRFVSDARADLQTRLSS